MIESLIVFFEFLWWILKGLGIDGYILVSFNEDYDFYTVTVVYKWNLHVVEVKAPNTTGVRDTPWLPFIPMTITTPTGIGKVLNVNVWGDEQQKLVIPMKDDRKVIFKIPSGISLELTVGDYTTMVNRAKT